MDEPAHSATIDWTWTNTNDPANQILTVYVRTQDMTLANKPHREILAFGTTLYTAPTKFSEISAVFGLSHLNHLGVSDWEFIGMSVNNPTTAFHFFKNQTIAESLVPYDTQEKIGDHYWPLVVLEVWLEEDAGFPQTANVISGNDSGIITAPTIYIHDEIIPDVEEGTLFITRKYQSSRRPPRKKRKIPHPMAMHIQVNGASREYPKCLHDEIIVRSSRSGSKQYLNGAATGSDVGGSISGRVYPATNFIGRSPYVLAHEPIRNAYGLWETTEVEVIPPKVESEER